MDSINSIAARILAALADADILAVHHGQGVLSCGDTAADHPSTEAAYGEVMAVVHPADGDSPALVAVSVVWRDDDGDIVDADDGADFNPDDLDGIVAEVCRLRGGAPARFEHVFEFAFSAVTKREDGQDVTAQQVRAALLNAARNMSDDELLENVGLPAETYRTGVA